MWCIGVEVEQETSAPPPKNTVQCVNKQTVVLLLHTRTGYKKLAHL